MVGMRGALLVSVVLVGVGAIASASSGTVASGRATAGVAVADRAVSHIAPPAAAANPASPGAASPVAASQPNGPTQPTWKLVPTSSLVPSGAASSGQPFFRGGVRSRVGLASPTTQAPRGPLAANPVLYNGLNKTGEIASSPGNAGGTPPDSTGAIGPNNYVEMVNSSIAVYDRNLNMLFRAPLTTLINFLGSLCDPQVQWDPTANRWLFAVLMCNNNPGAQGFVIGWSRTADPSTLSPAGWCSFTVITNPDLFDYPKLGHNSRYLIVGGNFYDESFANPPFVGSGIAWFGLPAVGDSSCALPSFQHNTNALVGGDGLTPAFTPVPVNTISGGTDGYILSAYDPGGNVVSARQQRTLAVWHLDAAGGFHQDSDVVVNPYNAPGSAPQLGTSDVIDTLDGRLTQAVGDPTTGIWTQHTVARSLGGRSEVDWYELTFPGTFPIPLEMGTVSDPTDSVFNAAISPSTDGQGAMIEYNRSGPGHDPLIAAKIRRAGTAGNTMEPGELILWTSAAADTDFSCNNPTIGVPCRWGDYSGATPDPVNTNVVWGTSEFNTASGATAAWSDRNFAILLETAPYSPTAVTATAGDQSATVSWTPSTFDAGTATVSYTITSYVGATPGPTMIVGAPTTGVIFKGLTNGVTYTFTVIANNAIGASPESPHSNAVTPTRAVQQVPIVPIGSRSGANQSSGGTPGPR
jgi:Fibronectin type III domain